MNWPISSKRLLPGGIGTLLELTKRLDLRKEINRAIALFKLHLPYDEADHVFNIAMNLLAGGNCLDAKSG